MTVQLQGQVAVVTGASRGIGRAVAVALADAGAAVVLAARSVDDLQRVAAAIAQRGGAAVVVATDVTDAGALQTLVDRTMTAYGRLDIVIHNAGILTQGRVDAVDRERSRLIVETNFWAAEQLTRLVLPVMRRQRHGHILAISSVLGRRGAPRLAAYAASKWALSGWMESVRGEVCGDGIAVTTVFAGLTRTDMGGHVPPSEHRGIMQEPEQVAAAVLTAIRTRQPEVYPFYWGKLLVILSAIAPRFVDWLWLKVQK